MQATLIINVQTVNVMIAIQYASIFFCYSLHYSEHVEHQGLTILYKYRPHGCPMAFNVLIIV